VITARSRAGHRAPLRRLFPPCPAPKSVSPPSPSPDPSPSLPGTSEIADAAEPCRKLITPSPLEGAGKEEQDAAKLDPAPFSNANDLPSPRRRDPPSPVSPGRLPALLFRRRTTPAWLQGRRWPQVVGSPSSRCMGHAASVACTGLAQAPPPFLSSFFSARVAFLLGRPIPLSTLPSGLPT
jgi:hypothetical protein